MKQNNVAVTGAAGYVGAYLADFLRARGATIYSMGRRKPLHAKDSFIPFTMGGTNDYSALNGIDTLIHCAYDYSLRRWDDLTRVNVEGSDELLREAKARGVKKIILISTICAHAGGVSNYAKIKFAVEERAEKVQAIIVRPGTVFSKDAGSIVGSMNGFVARFPAVPLIGSGDQIFYPCHNEDLAKAVWKLMEQSEAPAGPVTAASPQTITFKGLMLLLAKLNHKKVLTIPIPYPLLYIALETAERLGIRLGIRGGDSLLNLRTINKNPDFRETQKLGVPFRPFSVATLSE